MDHISDEIRTLYLMYLKKVHCLNDRERDCYIKYFEYLSNPPMLVLNEKQSQDWGILARISHKKW